MALDREHAKNLIERAYDDRSLLSQPEVVQAVEQAIEWLDRGEIRVASQIAAGNWETHTWVKQAIMLFFAIRNVATVEHGPFEYRDKIPLKTGYAEAAVRVVPPGVVRYGAHLCPKVVVMPGYVNIGAWVGEGSMVDTWATVGSCAQIGADCHLAGGVGIGGVLEPPGARPVVIEDGVFVGSRAIVVEGMLVEREAVIGAGVVLTASTAIIDVTGEQPVEHRGRVPARSVVIPGTRMKQFPAGQFGVPCALIIGKRSEATDKKVSLNAALRDFSVPV